MGAVVAFEKNGEDVHKILVRFDNLEEPVAIPRISVNFDVSVR